MTPHFRILDYLQYKCLLQTSISIKFYPSVNLTSLLLKVKMCKKAVAISNILIGILLFTIQCLAVAAVASIDPLYKFNIIGLFSGVFLFITGILLLEGTEELIKFFPLGKKRTTVTSILLSLFSTFLLIGVSGGTSHQCMPLRSNCEQSILDLLSVIHPSVCTLGMLAILLDTSLVFGWSSLLVEPSPKRSSCVILI